MSAPRVEAVGVLTAWGEGTAALPASARAAAHGRRVLPMAAPSVAGDRFRRATRECLLGVGAVDAMLRDAGLRREAVCGPSTALVYVTAAAYGAANLTFAAAAHGAGTLHFPYTAPSAVPAEVAIEFGLTGGYVILLGGAPTTLDALGQAGVFLARGQAGRVIVLAVETFAECENLWARGRWTAKGPLVEAAAAALLVAGNGCPAPASAAVDRDVAASAGETGACAPLIALALARAAGETTARVRGTWRGRRAALELNVSRRVSA